MKILVAEDNSASRRILEVILTKWGYNVVSASDGNEAWEKLQGPDAPKLAILDRIMPGMEGIDVCRKLRQIETTYPTYVIFLTARDNRNDIIEGLDAGGDDYITKPFDRSELGARIKAGRRIIEMQKSIAEKEKLQGVLEMAGAVCHELNQPLMGASGHSELLLLNLSEDNPMYAKIKKVKEQIDIMGEITKKLMTITKYETKDYLEDKIIDIYKAST